MVEALKPGNVLEKGNSRPWRYRGRRRRAPAPRRRPRQLHQTPRPASDARTRPCTNVPSHPSSEAATWGSESAPTLMSKLLLRRVSGPTSGWGACPAWTTFKTTRIRASGAWARRPPARTRVSLLFRRVACRPKPFHEGHHAGCLSQATSGDARGRWVSSHLQPSMRNPGARGEYTAALLIQGPLM